MKGVVGCIFPEGSDLGSTVRREASRRCDGAGSEGRLCLLTPSSGRFIGELDASGKVPLRATLLIAVSLSAASGFLVVTDLVELSDGEGEVGGSESARRGVGELSIMHLTEHMHTR
jgi:hypothetical protein